MCLATEVLGMFVPFRLFFSEDDTSDLKGVLCKQ